MTCRAESLEVYRTIEHRNQFCPQRHGVGVREMVTSDKADIDIAAKPGFDVYHPHHSAWCDM